MTIDASPLPVRDEALAVAVSVDVPEVVSVVVVTLLVMVDVVVMVVPVVAAIEMLSEGQSARHQLYLIEGDLGYREHIRVGSGGIRGSTDGAGSSGYVAAALDQIRDIIGNGVQGIAGNNAWCIDTRSGLS